MNRHDLELSLSWVAIVSLFIITELAVFSLNMFWIITGLWALIISTLPSVINRDIKKVLPFELLFLIALPFYLFAVLVLTNMADNPTFNNLMRGAEVMAIFLIAFVTIMDLHVYTSFRTNGPFAIFLTVLTTMAISSIFAIADFVSDNLLGTRFLTSNNELMINLIFSFLGGVMMGLILYFYLKKMPLERLERYSIGKLEEVQ